jgi:type IV secretion system protein VirB10
MNLSQREPTEPSAPNPHNAASGPPADETQEAQRESGEIPGERGIPSANRVRSVQSRATSVLAVTLMGALAATLMVWYYSGAIHRGTRAQALAQAATMRRAQGDTMLPSLGVIQPPRAVPAPVEERTPDSLFGPPPPIPVTAPEIPMANANPYAQIPYAQAGPPPKTPEESELERRLGGSVLAAAPNDRPATSASATDGDAATSGQAPAGASPVGGSQTLEKSAPGGEALSSLLKPTPTVAVRARVLPTQRFMLPKGAFIDCTLETAVSSALPGMTTCVTATDTFGADGNVVLLERGTKLVGETRGEVAQGAPRLFVLWTEARTPTGVVVPLASPGTDELGRSGLSGTIDRHWWLRFGTAILITVIDGAIQGATESHGNGGTIVLNPSTSSDVATQVLRGTLNIPPTIDKAQGDRIEILVARDVDFRSVYTLRPSAGEP